MVKKLQKAPSRRRLADEKVFIRPPPPPKKAPVSAPKRKLPSVSSLMGSAGKKKAPKTKTQTRKDVASDVDAFFKGLSRYF